MRDYDLSILIPARNEQFLKETVESIIANKRGKTEIIVHLDGAWANPPLPDHPDLTAIYSSEAIGQRAGTNKACKLSNAKWVMKCDAHVAFDEGFDVKLMADIKDNETVVPTLYNLHAFNWKCKKCGNEWYQGAKPLRCQLSGTDGNKPQHINESCDSKEFEQVVIFKPRLHKKSNYYRFDDTLHFQYWGAFEKRATEDIVEIMSIQGSCFMLSREKYWELNISDEAYGSWGQQGVEVALKTWLSGGRLVTNKKTWYSHMFRTQEGFSFPYPQSSKQVEHARQMSRDVWFNNKWEGQIYPLSWLLEKFKPCLDFHESGSRDKQIHGAKLLEEINRKGEEFYHKQMISGATDYTKGTRKGIIYYTDNQLNFKLAHKCRKQLLKAGLSIVSTSLKPMNFGKNIVLPFKRGYEAYFKQILTALENSEADIIYFGEHDWLYPLSHFDFIPPRKDTFYYNTNWWRVRSSDGHAVHYDTQLVPAIVAYRELLIEYYRKVVDYLDKVGFTGDNARKIGFEPGTSKRMPELLNYKVEHFQSKDPLIDIRHDNNLTTSKWSQDEFRNPSNAKGWVENDDEIPFWGKIFGRFDDFISAI